MSEELKEALCPRIGCRGKFFRVEPPVNLVVITLVSCKKCLLTAEEWWKIVEGGRWWS
jgi:hypothetical protein